MPVGEPACDTVNRPGFYATVEAELLTGKNNFAL